MFNSECNLQEISIIGKVLTTSSMLKQDKFLPLQGLKAQFCTYVRGLTDNPPNGINPSNTISISHDTVVSS